MGWLEHGALTTLSAHRLASLQRLVSSQIFAGSRGGLYVLAVARALNQRTQTYVKTNQEHLIKKISKLSRTQPGKQLPLRERSTAGWL